MVFLPITCISMVDFGHRHRELFDLLGSRNSPFGMNNENPNFTVDFKCQMSDIPKYNNSQILLANELDLFIADMPASEPKLFRLYNCCLNEFRIETERIKSMGERIEKILYAEVRFAFTYTKMEPLIADKEMLEQGAIGMKDGKYLIPTTWPKVHLQSNFDVML